MALGEDGPTSAKNQPPRKVSGCQPRRRGPRSRVCLLKGCGHRFRPEQPLARYCSEACRQQARRWRQWKARRRYRQSPQGQQKRQAQSRRYRERRKERPAPEMAVGPAARVIPTKFFFVLLRPPRMLLGVRAHPAVAAAALLLPGLPSGAPASSRAGEALGRTATRSGEREKPARRLAFAEAMKADRYGPDILRSSRSFR
jgi:hypothetical protein